VNSPSGAEGKSSTQSLYATCQLSLASHTPFAGAANIEQGITIDLSRLNQVTPSKDLSTVTIGPGNRWANVYLKLDALGIAIGGGRVATVGAGGLTLGGIASYGPTDGFATSLTS
jgi:FAD/FMN-containing dehydrogenase